MGKKKNETSGGQEGKIFFFLFYTLEKKKRKNNSIFYSSFKVICDPNANTGFWVLFFPNPVLAKAETASIRRWYFVFFNIYIYIIRISETTALRHTNRSQDQGESGPHAYDDILLSLFQLPL